MVDLLHAFWMLVCDLFKSQRRLRAENLFLRHQLNIALRRAPRRFRLSLRDRILLVWMTRVYPDLLGLAWVVKPETILRWHRAVQTTARTSASGPRTSLSQRSRLQGIRLPSGWHGRSRRLSRGGQRRAIWYAIMMGHMGMYSYGGFRPWGYVIDRSREGRHGKTVMWSASLEPCAGNVWTIS